ncbi:MAG: ribbon-helix-helix domain-containing protein [Metallosphaera sp.]|uniref:ribbon-helix-helix domain-containing protein n=1 Tax=Metallosphaera sp. TaxID=2020860 RepID=UPI003160FA84
MKVVSFKVEKVTAERAWNIIRRDKGRLSNAIRERVERIIKYNMPLVPTSREGKHVIITVKIPEELFQQIQKFIKERGVTQSELFRSALYLFIEDNKTKLDEINSLSLP